MKIEVSLKDYNKFKIKEEILNQIQLIEFKHHDYANLLIYQRRIDEIVDSYQDIYIEYDALGGDNVITFNKKIYDYYLHVQLVFSQIAASSSSVNIKDVNSLVIYLNNVTVFLKSYIKYLALIKNEQEDFNTMVKMVKENRELKKKNVDLEKQLLNITESDEEYFDF